MPSRRGPLSALLFVCWLVVPALAHAQSPAELARSRTLFESGLAHAQHEEWAEARQAFESALAITERPSILLNLATAQAETGALVESAASYRRFLEIATTRDQRANRAQAQRALAAIEGRLAHLTLAPVGLVSGDEILVDGTLRDASSLSALVMNPGAHDVAVRRDGRAVVEQHVILAEGQSQELSLVVPDLRPAVVATTAVEPTAPPVSATPEPSHGDDTLAIGLGVGIGGAVVVAGVIIAVVLATSSGGSTYQGNVGTGVIRF